MTDPDLSPQTDAEAAPAFLTTKEVATLLRVRERKVYDLAAEGGIPHRRITGKLLFPRDALMAWASGTDARTRPNVVTGSHDPLFDWAVGASGATMASLWNGSGPGLEAFCQSEAAIAVLHLPEASGGNIAAVAERSPREAVLLHWAKRQRGLLLSPHLAGKIETLQDLRDLRLVRRQSGAGATLLLEHLCTQAGLTLDAFAPVTPEARTEAEAAGMVARGEADAAFGIAAMARTTTLPFLPLMEESVDLLLCRRQAFDAPCQSLLQFFKSPALQARAEALGGYDLSACGAVLWLGP